MMVVVSNEWHCSTYRERTEEKRKNSFDDDDEEENDVDEYDNEISRSSNMR